MKKINILIICMALLILATTAVSASEDKNLTLTDQGLEIDNESAKEDLNPTLNFYDEIPKHVPFKGYYYLTIDGIGENQSDAVEIFIDDDNQDTYYEPEKGYELAPFKYPIGKHVLSAKFKGDEKYNPFNVNTTFKVVDVAIHIPDEITPSKPYVNIKIGKNAGGTAKVYANGDLYDIIEINKEFSFDYSNLIDMSSLEIGTYEIKVVYSGDKKFPKTVKKKTVNVSYDILTEIYPIYYGNGERGEFSLPEDVENMPTAKIDDKDLKVIKTSKTDYKLDYGNITPGMHNISITYPGDGKYPSKTIAEELEVLTEIETENYFSIENPGRVILKLPDDAKGRLCIYINSELYANVTPNTYVYLDRLKVGAYSLNANYSGDDYDVEEAFAGIEVSPKLTFPKVMRYGDNEICSIDFNEDINATLTYFSKKTTGKIKIVNGKGSFSLKRIDIGEKTNINFECPSAHGESFEVNLHLKVRPIPAKLVGGKDITMYYNGKNQYCLKVWGDYGKIVGANQIVKIKIGHKTYSVKTDKRGVAKLRIHEKPGKYTITATYHGTKQKNKLTVKHLLSLKSVKVKKSSKKLTLHATLKNKKAIKGKIITFKFNGKNYKAKTNSKGIAKVTIKSDVIKKLKVGKRITYQATYLKDIIKKTSTVKR